MIMMMLPRVLVVFVVVSVVLPSKAKAATNAPLISSGSICKHRVDIAFLLDGSGSVTGSNFLKMLDFVEKVVTKYTIGQDAALVAAVLFSTQSSVQFDFTSYTTKNDLLKAVRGIRYPAGGSTALDLGLKDIRTKVFTAAGGHRTGIPQVLVVMTDGRANSRLHAKAEADLVKAKCIHVLSLGIGNNTGDVQLQEIASDSSNVYRVHNFNQLVNFIGTLSKRICREAMTTPKTITQFVRTRTTTAPTAACSYTFENGVCRGHDVWSGKVSFAQCRHACNRRADCRSFQYRRPSCWLKNFVCSKSQLTNIGREGFAQYTKHCRDDKDSGCGSLRQQTGLSGTFSSMYQPKSYTNGANCKWIITVPSLSRILIQFSSIFNLEYHENCTFDSVSLYEDTSSTTPIGEYCHGNPADVISKDNDMVVIFKSDGSVFGRGFLLTWRAIPPTLSGCGSWYRRIGMSGFISSMNYPYNYQNDADRAWRISVPNGMHVRLEFEGKFELEPSDKQGCSFDSIVIRGLDASTGELGQLYGIFCGSSAPKTTIPTDDKDIAVFFKSDSTSTFAGFSLKWDAILYACGIPASPQNGRVTLSDHDKVHSKATYSCNAGYKLVGTNRRCQPSGRWSGDPPICHQEKS